MQSLLIGGDEACRAWLASCLSDELLILPADAGTPEQCVAEVADTLDTRLAFVQFDARGAVRQAAMVAALVAAYPAMPVVAVGRDDAGDVVLSAMRAGARDFFGIGRDDARIGALLDRVLARKPRPRADADGERGASHIVTCFSAAQAPSLAFVGGHIAFVMETLRKPKQRVLLFDLSLPAGNAAIIFDGAHDYTAQDILSDVERCDETLVESAFQRLDNGVYLLALPEDFNGDQFHEESLPFGRLVDIFRDLFDYVVICVDRGVGVANLATLIGRSDEALLISDQSVLRSRQNRALLEQLRLVDVPAASLKLVVANYRSEIGLDPDRLAELLQLPLAATLSGRASARAKAMNAGESMLDYAPSDGFTRDVAALAARLAGTETASRRHFATWRLFGWGG